MPLRHAVAPPGAIDLIHDNLLDVIRGTPDHIHGIRDIDVEHIHLGELYPAFHYGLDDLVAEPALLENAHLGTWNCLVWNAKAPRHEALGVAHVIRHEDDQLAFHGMSSGPLIAGKVAAVLFAERDPRTNVEGEDDFLVRFLSIPALRFVALWLHRSDKDFFVPLADGHGGRSDAEGGLQTRHFYEWSEVAGRLHAQALEVQAHGSPLRVRAGE